MIRAITIRDYLVLLVNNAKQDIPQTNAYAKFEENLSILLAEIFLAFMNTMVPEKNKM